MIYIIKRMPETYMYGTGNSLSQPRKSKDDPELSSRSHSHTPALLNAPPGHAQWRIMGLRSKSTSTLDGVMSNYHYSYLIYKYPEWSYEELSL